MKKLWFFTALSFFGLVALSVAGNYKRLTASASFAPRLGSRNALAQKRSMKMLSIREAREAVPAIMALRRSPFLDVRLNALRALARYRDPKLLSYFEDIILDYEGKFSPQERVLAVKAYVTIEGWNPEVLKEAIMLADNPVEKEFLVRALKGEKFFNLTFAK